MLSRFHLSLCCRRPRARASGSGFTLVELLLALSISALILGGISSTVFSLVSAQTGIEEITEEDRAARQLMHRLRREFFSVITGAGDSAVVIRDSDRRDELLLTTGAYGTPREIRYFWDGDVFTRTERDPSLLDPALPVPLGIIEEANFRYYDESAWRDSYIGADTGGGLAIELVIDGKKYGTIVAR